MPLPDRSHSHDSREKTLRTMSVRLGSADVARLAELKALLNGADRKSFVGQQWRSMRGRHTDSYAPVADGEAIRWALRYAIERYPIDLGSEG